MNAELVSTLSISPDVSLRVTAETLSKTSRGILLVVDTRGVLLGVVTDYDIRQAILNDLTLDAPVEQIIKRDPVVVRAGAKEREIVALFQETARYQIPVLDPDGRPVDIRFRDDFLHLSDIRAGSVAVIMAGGFGTRLRPMTEQVPKPLLEVAGRPMLFILLDQVISEGFDKIYITLFYKSQMVINRVREVARYRNCVHFVMENTPLGTAGSLSLLPERPTSPFLVMNADLLTEVPLREMLDFHNRENNAVTVALKRDSFKIPYGVAEVQNGRIIALREKPAYDMDVNTGVYIVSPSVLDYLPKGQRCDMPQLVNQLLDSNAQIGSFPIHEFWLDVGTHEHFEKAQIRYKNRAGPKS